nr:MAG TPA: hypothetical protein [Caudoviricetes sp.]
MQNVPFSSYVILFIITLSSLNYTVRPDQIGFHLLQLTFSLYIMSPSPPVTTHLPHYLTIQITYLSSPALTIV